MKEEEKKEIQEFDLVDELQKIEKPKKKMPTKYKVLIIIGIIICIPTFTYFSRYYLYYSWEKLEKTEYLLKVDMDLIKLEKEKKKKLFFSFERIDEHHRYLYILTNYEVYSYYNDSYYKIDPLKGITVDYQSKIKEDDYDKIIKELNEIEKRIEDINNIDDSLKENNYIIRHDRFYYSIKKEDLIKIFQDNHINLDNIII